MLESETLIRVRPTGATGPRRNTGAGRVTLATQAFGIDLLTQTRASVWLMYVAGATVLIASLVALTKDNLKARLAYSTISQLSYIVLGAALAIPTTRAKINDAALPIIDNFRGKIVPGRLKVMADQLDVRLSRGESLPAGFEGWLRRDYSSVAEDPWGNYYYLETNRRGYTVGSMGPDGIQGSDDDFTEERRTGR